MLIHIAVVMIARVQMLMDDDTILRGIIRIDFFHLSIFISCQKNISSKKKILYKTHQHWIIPVLHSMRLLFIAVIPAMFFIKFISYSWLITMSIGFLVMVVIIAYDWYLWNHSWLMVGNQKVTLAIRNGIWSQYAMSIRYRNIRDCAISKNSMWGYLFKYGSLFIRSSANE